LKINLILPVQHSQVTPNLYP